MSCHSEVPAAFFFSWDHDSGKTSAIRSKACVALKPFCKCPCLLLLSVPSTVTSCYCQCLFGDPLRFQDGPSIFG